VATLGLNPSNREFVDESGMELDGPARRLHTLKSLGLLRWSQANSLHLSLIEASFREYFIRNPYNGWFRSLDQIISGTKASYYAKASRACHLDLVPYATECKWTNLTARERSLLLSQAMEAIGVLLQDSPVRVIILNGRTVIENLQKVAAISLDRVKMRNWTLPRREGPGVEGFAFRGNVRRLFGVDLGRPILMLGYNHNIQSSFGVTTDVKGAIRNWITQAVKDAIL
jgi:hypothetical protein